MEAEILNTRVRRMGAEPTGLKRTVTDLGGGGKNTPVSAERSSDTCWVVFKHHR